MQRSTMLTEELARVNAAEALLRASEFLAEAAEMTREGVEENTSRKRAWLIEWAQLKVAESARTLETRLLY